MKDEIAYLPKRHRLNCGYSQQMVANALNVDRTTYTYYETGRSMPSLSTLMVLKNLLNIPYEELLSCLDRGGAIETEKLKDPTNTEAVDKERTDTSHITLEKKETYGLPKDEQQLLLYFRRMDDSDREKALDYLKNIVKENY